jgi:DNA-binding NarL/FixJ family response regulator
MKRVLIAAADSALRNALKLILRQRLALAIAGEAATEGELATSLARLQPDLLLLDWALPEFQDSARLRAYQAAAPSACIMVLNVPTENIPRLLAAGANFCLASGALPQDLIRLLCGCL